MCLFIVIIVFTNLLALKAVTIDKLVVPDVVQSGAPEGAVLDCVYAVNSTRFTLQWFFNGGKKPLYQWRPGEEPVVRGLHDGKLDLTYRASNSTTDDRRALRILSLGPELSGDYTCKIVTDDGQEARLTKSMLVFSPERDFTLVLHKQNQSTRIQCVAREVFPKPELTLEHDSEPFAKQHQRIWRTDGSAFDVESTAMLELTGRHCRPRQITCRLHLPQAGYVAMKKELIYIDGEQHCKSGSSTITFSVALIFAFSTVKGTTINIV